MTTATCSRSRRAPGYWRKSAWRGMGATRLHQPKTHCMMDTTKKDTIPARSSPWSTRTAPSVAHQGRRDKCTTGATSPPKVRGRDNVAIATGNVRTLAQTGKLQELTHELEKYTWHVVGLCEVRWKNYGEHLNEEGHVLYYSGEMDKHTNGVGFLVNKNIKNSVLCCHPVSNRAISIRLRAAPLNISIVQAYAPTTDHDDDAVEGDWNAKVGKDALKGWKEFCGPSCNDVSNERGLRLLEFASYNNAVLARTLGEHKASRRWTWHAPNGIHHNQIDYILVQNLFRSRIKRATTRTFPGADVSSDHDLVFVNFKQTQAEDNQEAREHEDETQPGQVEGPQYRRVL
ncbi:craniofacial development protein 2-like [Palaemon carinicauda]|uniref:craniofacial development protein 2-like n=1 Tax=Palaemon carinicauda TaxID=392227 RepID=UPI0035B5AAD8